MTDARGILREHGIAASAQRLAIYEHVAAVRTHPSADAVYEALRDRIPTLSRTTVYSTLRLFREQGLVLGVPSADGCEMRFDGDVRPHAHFRCSACGGLFDVPCEGDPAAACALPEGFSVAECAVVLGGICADCAKTPSRGGRGVVSSKRKAATVPRCPRPVRSKGRRSMR